MTRKHITLASIAAALVLLIGLAVFFRYEVVTAGGRVYKVDRWTGNTIMVSGRKEWEVTPASPLPKPVDWNEYSTEPPKKLVPFTGDPHDITPAPAGN